MSDELHNAPELHNSDIEVVDVKDGLFFQGDLPLANTCSMLPRVAAPATSPPPTAGVRGCAGISQDWLCWCLTF